MACAIDGKRAAALAAAIIFAALTPAAVIVLPFGGTFGVLYFAFGLMLAPTLLALPFFAVLDRKGLANAVTSIAVGIAMGTILGGMIFGRFVSFPYAETVAAFGGLGALGGAAFWSALKLGGWWRGDDDPSEKPE